VVVEQCTKECTFPTGPKSERTPERHPMNFLFGYLYHLYSVTSHKCFVALYIFRHCWKHRHTLLVSEQCDLLWRAFTHDLSKYRWSEAKAFAGVTLALWNTTYGTPEYRALLKRIKPAIDLHYRRNRHHPEHLAGGIHNMLPFDRVEMVADWCAAVRRHKDGDIFESLEINQCRFDYSDIFKANLTRLAKTMLRTP